MLETLNEKLKALGLPFIEDLQGHPIVFSCEFSGGRHIVSGTVANVELTWIGDNAERVYLRVPGMDISGYSFEVITRRPDGWTIFITEGSTPLPGGVKGVTGELKVL